MTGNDLIDEDNSSTSQDNEDFIMPRNGPYNSTQCLSHSKLQSPLTIKWLNEHYKVAEGVSLPRSSLYAHYLDFCQKSSLNPVNAASFGKIIRHNFPNLKTRRLGTRGQSKYHYYGITIKETSPYHDTLLNSGRQNTPNHNSTKVGDSMARSQTNSSGKSTSSNQHSLMSSSGGTLLPLFPKSEALNLPPSISKDKVRTFLIMYRAHCQRILDTILRANFGEVQKFLVHFWQGMPEHILTILSCPEVIDLVGVCDGILFKAIGSVLIPGVLQPLPASLTQAIRQFAQQLSTWLESSLTHFPEKLKEKKLEVANVFSKSLRRKTSLTHLAQAARTVLHSTEPVTQMIADWQEIDFKEIVKQTLWTFSSDPATDCQVIEKFLLDFTQLLEQQATIDQYAEWASNLVDSCLKKYFEVNEDEDKAKERSRQFLLKWSFFSTQVMRELTLKSAQSFGSFHLLHILLEDYIVYCVECQATSRAQDADFENKAPMPELCEPTTEDMDVQDVCDIEVIEEADQSPSISSDNEPITPRRQDSSDSVIKSPTYADAYPEPYPDTPSAHVPVVNPVSEHRHQANNVSTSDNSESPGMASRTTESRSFLHLGTNNSQATLNTYLSTRGLTTISSSPYGIVGGQNMLYGGMYGSMNDACSPTDLKSYTQYARQDNPPYPGRYLFSPSVVSGSPMYTRNLYPENNGRYREGQFTGHQGYDRRFHSRVLGEHVVPQPTMLGAQ